MFEQRTLHSPVIEKKYFVKKTTLNETLIFNFNLCLNIFSMSRLVLLWWWSVG